MNNEKKITKVFFLVSAFAIGFVTCAVAMAFLFMDAFGSENSVELGMRKLTDPLKNKIGLAKEDKLQLLHYSDELPRDGSYLFYRTYLIFSPKKKILGDWRELKDFGDIVKIFEVRMGGKKIEPPLRAFTFKDTYKCAKIEATLVHVERGSYIFLVKSHAHF